MHLGRRARPGLQERSSPKAGAGHWSHPRPSGLSRQQCCRAPDTPAAPGAASAPGAAASNASATTQPQRADKEPALPVTACRKPADGLPAGMRPGPFLDRRTVRLDAARHGWRGKCHDVARFAAHNDGSNCTGAVNASSMTGDYATRRWQVAVRARCQPGPLRDSRRGGALNLRAEQSSADSPCRLLW